MSFGNAVKSFFTNYANFNGRARRSELWYSFLFVVIASFAANFIDGFIGGFIAGAERTGIHPIYIVAALVNLALILPWIAVSVRRLHDINKTGWWYLIYLIPLVGGILFIIWGIKDTEPAANQWGQPAK